MRSTFESNVSATPPAPPASPAHGHPQSGNPSALIQATKEGAYWPYMITQELLGLITAGGLTPDHTNLTQLRDAAIAMWGAGRPGHAFSANDWVPLASGFIFQYGNFTPASGGSTLTFPLTFPNAGRAFVGIASGTYGQSLTVISQSVVTNNTTSIGVQAMNSTTGAGFSYPVSWIAVGN